MHIFLAFEKNRHQMRNRDAINNLKRPSTDKQVGLALLPAEAKAASVQRRVVVCVAKYTSGRG